MLEEIVYILGNDSELEFAMFFGIMEIQLQF